VIKKFTSIDEVNNLVSSDIFKPKIAVMGIGGAGTNAINNMIHLELSGVQFIVINTDSQALEKSICPTKLQIGPKVTRGLGAGSKPEMGVAAAEESIEDIKQLLEGVNLLFITAGMGGGTGTGASQVVAKVAKEMGILTIAFITKPFDFEGSQKLTIATKGTNELEKLVDCVVVVANQNLFKVIDQKTSMIEAFKVTDNVLYLGIKSITDLIISSGLVNLDFNDIRSTVEGMGRAMIGSAEAEGPNKAIECAEAAIVNPLLENISIAGAKKILINITGGSDMTLHEVDEIISFIKKELDNEAFINFGTIYDENMNGRLRLSIVATGLEANSSRKNEVNRNNFKSYQKNEDKDNITKIATNNVLNQFLNKDDTKEKQQEQDNSSYEVINDLVVQNKEPKKNNDIFSAIMDNKDTNSMENIEDDSQLLSIKNREKLVKETTNSSNMFDLPSFLKKKN
jgi:cell division protein FtsZ